MKPGRLIPTGGLVALVVCACVGVGLAQRTPERIREGAWNSSLTAAQSLARYTGRPVLIFFAEDWCGHCEDLERLLAHRDLREVTRRFVLVKLNPDAHPGTVQKYKIDGHHQVVMLDWSGRVAGEIRTYETARDVALAMVAAAAANDKLAGDKLLDLGYYAKAAERYNGVLIIARDPKMVDAVRKKLEDIRSRARQQLELIKQLVLTRRPEEALDACRRMIEDFPPEMGGKEAKKILGRLLSGKPVAFDEKEPKPAPGVKEPGLEQLARKMLDAGMVHEWDKRFYDAVTTYRRLKTLYPHTKAALEADQRINQLLADEQMKEIIARQKMDKYCRRRIEMAELYEENGLTAMAVKYYQDVIAAYPDSGYAAEARRRVKVLTTRNSRKKDTGG